MRQRITYYRPQTQHGKHALATFCTCFLWFLPWMLIWAWNVLGPRKRRITYYR